MYGYRLHAETPCEPYFIVNVLVKSGDKLFTGSTCLALELSKKSSELDLQFRSQIVYFQ